MYVLFLNKLSLLMLKGIPPEHQSSGYYLKRIFSVDWLYQVIVENPSVFCFLFFFLTSWFLSGHFSSLEQILYNIKQEYKRMQKRRHLETSFQQTDPCCTSEAQPHAFLLSGPASPGNNKLKVKGNVI